MEGDDKSPLSKAFGTDDTFAKKQEIDIYPPGEVAPLPQDDEGFNTRYVDADYEYARTNITHTIEKMDEALDDLMKLARASQAARSYEVLATMFKTQLDANKDLLELAKRNKDLKEQERQSGAPDVTNNTLVVTSDQLLSMLAKQGVETKSRQQEE